MELFGIVKMNLAMCLFYPNQTHILDAKRLVVMIVGVLPIGSIALFILLEADEATHYVISVFSIVATFGIFISFVDTTIKTTMIFSLVDLNVRIIEKSKHHQQPSLCPIFDVRLKRTSLICSLRNGILIIEGTVHPNESSIGKIL